MPVDLTCEAAITRGKLKHSWLENQVLNKSVVDVIQMRSEGIWEALEFQFPVRIVETLSLARDLASKYSPALIVTNLACFAELPEVGRTLLKDAVHNAYLSRCRFVGDAATIEMTTIALSAALQQVQGLWQEGSSNDLGGAWRDVLDAAAKLRDELDSLPGGIVLP